MLFTPYFLEASAGEALSTLDIILGLFLAIGLIRGILKGFISELASLLALILGIYGAIHFSYFTVDFLDQYIHWDTQYLNIIALILTFIIIVVFVFLLGKIFTKLAKLMALGIVNRIFGGIFGVLKAAFILSILIMFFTSFNKKGFLIKEETLEASVLYEPIAQFGETILPSVLEEIKTHSDWTGDFGL